MNKKSACYLLLALIALMAIADLCYATPVPMYARDVKNGTDSKPVPPFVRQFDLNNNKTTAITADDAPVNYPIGLFTYTVNGNDAICTASIINTPNGNIAVTAAHCIFNTDGTMHNDIVFFPGFDNGDLGPLEGVAVAVAKAPDGYFGNNPDNFDYAMVRFTFNDPSGNNRPLQYYSGALGWWIDVGTNIQTVGLGYPEGGNLPNCANDGIHLCRYSGTAVLDGEYRMDGPNVGGGASGGPWVYQYDQNRNLGYVFGVYYAYIPANGRLLSPVFNLDDWHAILDYVSNH